MTIPAVSISGIEYRVQQSDDVPLLKEFARGMKGIRLSESDMTLKRMVERNPGLSCLATVNDAIVGFVLIGENGLSATIEKIAVHSSLRGRKIGTNLVNFGIKALEGSTRVRRVYAHVPADNFGAYMFFHRRGFSDWTSSGGGAIETTFVLNIEEPPVSIRGRLVKSDSLEIPGIPPGTIYGIGNGSESYGLDFTSNPHLLDSLAALEGEYVTITGRIDLRPGVSTMGEQGDWYVIEVSNLKVA